MSQIDEKSKVLFGKFLIKKGFGNIQFTTSSCRWDLEAEYKGNKYYFELKDRRVYKGLHVDDYGDSIIEEGKYEELKKLPEGKVYISNIFLDNKLTIFNLRDEFHKEKHWADETTCFNSHKKVLKTFCCWLNTEEHIYTYDEE